jgi:hypothetical protein
MKVNEGGGVAHEEENIDVMEMSYDMRWLRLAKLKMQRQSSYCSMLKLSSFKTIFLEFRNMNNQKKGVLFIVRYLTLVSEFCDCYWNKGHSTCRNGFWRWTIACVVLAPLP